MQNIRVIPCLDIKDGRVVKGVNFVNLKDQGDPVELAMKYVSEGADELVFLDITATTSGRQSTYSLISETAKKVTIPFTVGGGVRSVDDAKKMISSGADKVGVNSAAVADPTLITQISSEIGREKLVLAIDVKKTGQTESGYEVVTQGGNNLTRIDAVAWAKLSEKSGAGEILLTSMESDGMKNGFDGEIIRSVAKAVSVPVVASGGAGDLEHFVQAARDGASAVLAASVFHTSKYTVSQVKAALGSAGFATSGK